MAGIKNISDKNNNKEASQLYLEAEECFKEKNIVKALALLTQDITSKDNLLSRKLRGEIFLMMGRVKEAEEDAQVYYRMLLKADPEMAKKLDGKFAAKGTEGGCSAHKKG